MRYDAESDLEDLLRGAAPQELNPRQQQEVFEDTWCTLMATVSTSAAGAAGGGDLQGRRARRTGRLAAISLTVALAGAGTAAAAYISAHTGQRTTGWEVSAAGPGEVLRMDGTDYLEVAHQLTTDIPFAPAHQTLRDAQFRTGYLAAGPDSSITTGALRAQVAQNAICTWVDAWAAADATGDTGARQVAADTLTASLTWTAVTDIDPTPSTTGDPGNPGAETLTRFGWVPAIAAAAAAGDRVAVLTAVTDSGRCNPELTPALQTDPTHHDPAR